MKILSILGTRPDAIKIIPVHFALQQAGIQSVICATSQHIDMLNQVLNIFQVTPDFNLHVMEANQNLFDLTSTILMRLKEILEKVNPSVVLVQGDTTTAFSGAMASFYKKIPIGHIEAGLRTGSIEEPYPEEINRRFIDMVSTYHFAPTSLNVANLLAERINRNSIVLTGNTVVDSLHMIIKKIENGSLAIDQNFEKLIKKLKSENKTIALLTAHRRESFNGGLHDIFQAAKIMALQTPELAFIYPHHPNPQVIRAIAETEIGCVKNIYLLPPLAYQELVYCLMLCDWVATDSGGIQEEAISMGKPVVILREKTERMEGVWAGVAHLAGTNRAKVLTCMKKIHAEKKLFAQTNIYGDGHSSKKIASFIGSLQKHTTQSATIESRFSSIACTPK